MPDQPSPLPSPLKGVPHYIFLERLGEGGMGIVYRVLDRRIGREVALKIPKPRIVEQADAQWIGRFIQEAQIAAALGIPGVLPIYELDHDEATTPYYTMPLFKKADTLEDLLTTAEGRAFPSRGDVLDIVIELSEVVAEANARGVLHRDVKPANVALGPFDRVTLIDWGVAWVDPNTRRKDVPQPARHVDLVLQAVLEERAARGIKTQGGVGTIAYMAPELLAGSSSHSGASEVFALGVVLFEALCGRRPRPDDIGGATLAPAQPDWPPDPQAVDPAVPRELADICVRALAAKPEERYASAQDLALALARWRDANRLEALVQPQLLACERAIAQAEASSSDRRIHWAQLALELTSRIPPEAAVHSVLLRNARSLNERGVAEAKEEVRSAQHRRSRRAMLFLGGAALLILFGVMSFAWGVSRDRDEKEGLYRRLARLSDAQRVSTLVAESEGQWPVYREFGERSHAWLVAAEALVSREPQHRDELTSLRATGRRVDNAPRDAVTAEDMDLMRRDLADLEDARVKRAPWIQQVPHGDRDLAGRARIVREQLEALEGGEPPTWEFSTTEARWRHAELERIVEGIEQLQGPEGLIAQVRKRRADAMPTPAWRAAWDAARGRLAADARFRGLSLPVNRLLHPLGPDPESGLEEFALLHTGAVPHRTDGRALEPRLGDAVVLVLVPPGGFRRWFPPRPEDEEVPSVGIDEDLDAKMVEWAGRRATAATHVDDGLPPPRSLETTLGSYLIGKWELTQDQWLRVARDGNPSHERSGERTGITLLNPVESVTWHEVRGVLAQFGARLPTEAEWEYACRGGHDGWRPCFQHLPDGVLREVRDFAALGDWMNTADATLHEGNRGGVAANLAVRDRHHFHAPVGSYPPNPYGLHDMLGNVSEWCLDCMDSLAYLYAGSHDPAGSQARFAPDERIYRGGSWANEIQYVLTSKRRGRHPGQRDRTIGVRVAFTLKEDGR